MRTQAAYLVVGLLWWMPLCGSAQQVRVMQWNVLGGLGKKANNTNAQAQAIARIINYNQPDILLFNEIASANVASNTAALIDFVTNSLPYLGTQPGTTFYVAVSTQTDNFNRNAAISRYPILTPATFDDGLRGLHSFKVQLTGTNVLQVFHTHLKCCSDDCPRKQAQAQFDADVMSGWALTNAGPYIIAGDLNEDEENPLCTLSSTYHPITTIREDGGVVEFKPTMLNGEYRTWSTANASPSVRFDYILAATNRLTASSGYVFSTMDWAAHGLYTNLTGNLVNDSRTASDHYPVFVDYSFPTASAGIVVSPATDFTSSGNPGGPFSPASQTYIVANTNTTAVSWTASKTASWLTLSATSGTLAAAASTNITVSINSNADTLPPGSYTDTVTFRDTTAGASVTRTVTLTVLGPPNLTVSPAGSFSSAGPPGGPFNPAALTYTLSNSGSSPLDWTANKTATWLSLAPTSGTLAGGASTTVVVSVNANANTLPEGVYTDTIGFTNTTNGAGNTTRTARLSVSAATFGFADNFSTYAAGNLVGQNNWQQLGTVATLPLQIKQGQVVIPYGQTADNQDAYKNFTQTNITVYYGALLSISNAPNTTTPSYFIAMTLSNNGTGFANYRLGAKAFDAANTNYVFGTRVTGQTAEPWSFGTAGLRYAEQAGVIVEATAGGTLMKLYVNPTGPDPAGQTPYLTDSNSGTPPGSVGSFVISQFAGGSVSNAGVAIARVAVADSFAAVYNALFPPPQFTVSPAADLNASGPEGGPFSPPAQQYTLTNTNSAPAGWKVTANVPWLSLSPTTGTLAAAASTNVTVSINSAAEFLFPGNHSAQLLFTDTGNGGTATRAVALTVLALPALVVSPDMPFHATGLPGGPFTPSQQTYTLGNSGSITMNWTASHSAPWLSVAPAAGAIAAGSSTVVTASLTSAANSLEPGSYNDLIAFTNTDTGLGNASRTANLTVVDPNAAGFFDDVESGTNGWTATGLWHIASTGTPACATAHSPSHAWWYGQNATCNYRTCGGCTNSGSLISPPFVVPGGGTLTFWSWEDTEGTGTVNDQRIVFISTNATTNVWIQLHQSTNDAAAWYQVSIGLAPYAGKTARLRFFFNANANNNRFGGWFVDDVRVAGPAVLSVTPNTTVAAAGEQGGPFAPGLQSYTLSNPGGGSLSWSASVSNNWLSLSASSGTLAAGASTTVTVMTNANATALVGGLYSNLVSFVNLSNGAGSTGVWWTLLVRDGIPDAWRLQYFGHVEPRADDQSRAADDPDGDGLNNLGEYVFGSVPTNAASAVALQIARLADGSVQLSFSSVTGRVYTLEFRDSLGSGSWQAVSGFQDVAGTGGTMSWTDNPGAAGRFYRLRARIAP